MTEKLPPEIGERAVRDLCRQFGIAIAQAIHLDDASYSEIDAYFNNSLIYKKVNTKKIVTRLINGKPCDLGVVAIILKNLGFKLHVELVDECAAAEPNN